MEHPFSSAPAPARAPREQQIQLLLLSCFPGHALNVPSTAWISNPLVKTKHTRQTRCEAVPRASFPCRGLRSHKAWKAGWAHTLWMTPGGAGMSRELLWVSPPSAASHIQPSGILSLPAQRIFPILGFKAVCVSGNFPPVSTPKAQPCLQGETKHPSPSPDCFQGFGGTGVYTTDQNPQPLLTEGSFFHL